MNVLVAVLVLTARTVFAFTDPAIDESSGLVDLGGVMVTTNDSGDDAILYVVDPRTGATVGHTRYADEVSDVEALAPAGRNAVWVADIGDNNAVRRDVTVYRVPVGRGERAVEAPSYRLVYPGGPRDAESLFVSGGRLHVISKGVFGGRIFRAPARLRAGTVNRWEPVGRVGVFATDAAMFPDGRHLLVRGYGRAEVLAVPGFARVAGFDLPAQEQGEGVSIGPNGRIRLSSEGVGSAVLQIPLPAGARAAIAPREPEQSAGPAPSPEPAPGVTVTAPEDGPNLLVRGGAVVGGLVLVAGAVALWRRRRRP